MSNIQITYPELPPSSNRIYFRGKILTAKAREYKEKFKYEITRNYLPEISQMNKDGVFALHLRFYFNELVNKTYFDPVKKKRAETLYKKLDLTNRIKLLEDCIRDSLAIDDCQTFAASQEKHQDPGNERVEILVQEVDPELFGVPSVEVANAMRDKNYTLKI